MTEPTYYKRGTVTERRRTAAIRVGDVLLTDADGGVATRKTGSIVRTVTDVIVEPPAARHRRTAYRFAFDVGPKSSWEVGQVSWHALPRP